MSKKNKKTVITIIMVILILSIIVLSYKLYKKNKESILVSENIYNQSLQELVDYIGNVKNYLAKSTISTSSTHGAETLTSLWREANLAQTYLSMLPIESQDLENTQKFLNQVSDYSYSLSRKNINGEDLSQDDLNNLQNLYNYSVEMSNVITQIYRDINNGYIKWSDLQKSEAMDYAQEVSSNIDMASILEENFHQYEGLIYDGAYSDHITSTEKKGLTGKKISEEDATQRVKQFIGESNIEKIENLGLSENASTPVYTYNLKTKKNEMVAITISEIGGHIVYMNSNRQIKEEKLSYDEANQKGKEFLNKNNYINMKETYFLIENGIITINYAYIQDNVVMYPDLIKVKIALDDGEILGVEAKAYLNNHFIRDISNIKITMDEAKKTINKKLEIKSEGMAVIPTEWNSEILCYEFKGKIDETDYLIYINCETGKEEDILIIVDTPNGILTM